MEDLIIFDGDEYYCTECGENFTHLTEDGYCPYCDTKFTGDDSPR